MVSQRSLSQPELRTARSVKSHSPRSMVGKLPIADTEATEADRTNTCLPALPVAVDAPGQRTPAGASAASLGNAHNPENAIAEGCRGDEGAKLVTVSQLLDAARSQHPMTRI